MEKVDKINILLVDDRPENLLALEAIIEQDDYHLIKASSGEEALKFLMKYDFAAILLDVQMPGMDGIRTAKIIKAREKTKHIPILFITANHMDSEHIFMGYSAGAMDYILKPFDPFVLKAKVEGFVNLYKLQQKLVLQAEILEEKTEQLEKTNQELMLTTANLRQSEAIANVIRNTSLDSMLLLNQEGFILQVNPTAVEMFRYEESMLIAKPLSILFEEDVMRYFHRDDIGAGYTSIAELTGRRSDGTTFFAGIQLGRQNIDGSWITACTIRDISERKKHEEITTYMAYHDGLTKLSNKHHFNIFLANHVKDAKLLNQPFGVLYLDLDRFKSVNDSLGHLIGDKLLQEVAKRLTAIIREGDFIARVGGDEFNIILPNTSREEALQIAENIIDGFKQAFYIEQYELFVTTCIGLSVFPYDGDDSLELIKNADAALYRAKKLGKDRFQIYHAGLNVQSYRTFMMQNDLRKALANGELSIMYQPRVNLVSGKVESVEASMYWNHPSWGTILPDEFIPLAEETGRIVPVGLWYFQEVCKEVKRLADLGFSQVRAAVSLTTQQFLQKDLMASLNRIIQDTGANPKQLEIRVRESTIQEYEETVRQLLEQLQSIGFYIMLQDYGKGHLSVPYISKLPIDGICLEESFVNNLIGEGAEGSLLASTLISLAHRLKLHVMTTGIDKVAQLEILTKWNCKEAQGDLFVPAVPVDAMEEILHKNEDYLASYTTVLANLQETSATTEFTSSEDKKEDHKQQFLKEAFSRIKDKYAISTREMDVFVLILDGLSNKEIAEQLFISEHTVKNHLTRIFHKLGVNDRVQAISVLFQTYSDNDFGLN
ncbi:EAL domain-containing protein [Ornithinibacillus contaminans]|uniref:EAL domain-containing protein n=1 Tax=Ornithinibacillus contaminans TaxID=694055 RepID=UPI00064DC9CF|nr:EAL domain-containing protein [Ornithinibacillus contaminans]